MKTSVKPILDQLEKAGIKQATFFAHSFEEEDYLSPDDKDYVTFHKQPVSPFITDKLLVCDVETTASPIYKDWMMSINYHS